jgi:hypothetical protein
MCACAQLAKERLEHADFDRASYEALHSSLSDEIDDGPFVEPSAVLRALTRAIYGCQSTVVSRAALAGTEPPGARMALGKKRVFR